MSYKRRPTAQEKQIKLIAILVGVLLLLAVVGVLLLLGRPVGGYR